MKTAICLLVFFGLAASAGAESKWFFVKLERTPVIDRRGNLVERPVFYAKDKRRLTTGGEWIVPKELKVKAIERYQREGTLLMLVDVPAEAVLPGTVNTAADSKQIKKETFGILPIKAESGVTN